MKKLCCLLVFYILLTFVSNRTFAQQFTAINSNDIYYFKEMLPPGTGFEYMCVYTDTVIQSNGDTLYQLRKIPDLNGEFGKCLPMKPTFMGSKIIKRTNELLFFNQWDDTLKLNTSLEPGWTLFHKNDSLKINIYTSYFGQIKDMVMDLPDSLYCFKFMVVTHNGDTLKNHLIAKQQICFSSSWGIVNSLPWYDFPYFNTFDRHRELIGILSKDGTYKTGITNKYEEHTFDYAIGDEIHTHFSDCGWYQRNVSYICIEEFVRTRIIDKVVLNDKIQYKKSIMKEYTYRKNFFHTPSLDSNFKSQSIDTIYQTVDYSKSKYPYTLKHLYTQLPGNGITNFYLSNICDKWVYSDALFIETGAGIYQNNDTCWMKRPEPTYISQSWFYDGIGGPFYSTNKPGDGSIRNELVYYKTAGCTFGTPIGLEKFQSEQKLEVYPNPVSKEFVVQLKGSQKSLRLELLSLTGELILSKYFTNGEAINISEYSEGLYFLRIFETDTNKFYNTRLLISR
jgi:hypothetical protein